MEVLEYVAEVREAVEKGQSLMIQKYSSLGDWSKPHPVSHEVALRKASVSVYSEYHGIYFHPYRFIVVG